MDRRQKGIRPRGGSILIDFTYKGVRCRETLKLKPTKENLAFASRKRDAILYEIALDKFDYLEHFPESPKARLFSDKLAAHQTIEVALKGWLKRAERRCAPSTLRDYNSAVYYHLIPQFGRITLDKLTAAQVNDWITTLVDLSPKRINNVLTPLRQTMTEAYCEELIDKNPMDRVKNLPKRTREPQPFSQDEISKILSALDSQAKNLIQFAFWSGLRTSELIGLEWKDFEEQKKCLHVRRAIVRNHEKTTKTSSGQRTLWLTDEAFEALQQQKEYTKSFGKRIFHDPRSNEPKLNDQIIRKRIWTPALKTAGIQYREPYQTRHTFASMMLTQGKSPLWVANQLGHSNPSQTYRNYARWISQELNCG
ncbi:Arm DNA-binding domain-containing protein [Litoribrevibacter albus]|uniref:Site-specific integrase n=1 Tax=Litoribrevibacter albus TaxID=1473156 RepID=A0AA37W5P8_9GAMM|nr:DUF3596 domain-containing protein [Litoribrevibacter albus]GLQ29668.1 site-specific integrase [Litoribrevibacter albus]